MPKIERKAIIKQSHDACLLATNLRNMAEKDCLGDEAWLTAMLDLTKQLADKANYLQRKLGHHLGVPKAE
jgi:hypothetical protein